LISISHSRVLGWEFSRVTEERRNGIPDASFMSPFESLDDFEDAAEGDGKSHFVILGLSIDAVPVTGENEFTLS
jgi:hypothetical protein